TSLPRALPRAPALPRSALLHSTSPRARSSARLHSTSLPRALPRSSAQLHSRARPALTQPHPARSRAPQRNVTPALPHSTPLPPPRPPPPHHPFPLAPPPPPPPPRAPALRAPQPNPTPARAPTLSAPQPNFTPARASSSRGSRAPRGSAERAPDSTCPLSRQ